MDNLSESGVSFVTISQEDLYTEYYIKETLNYTSE